MARRKFYKTIITVEVLSEDRYPDSSADLKDVEYWISDGEWSGAVHFQKPERLTGAQMAKECQAQATDPGFFQLDAKGKTLREG